MGRSVVSTVQRDILPGIARFRGTHEVGLLEHPRDLPTGTQQLRQFRQAGPFSGGDPLFPGLDFGRQKLKQLQEQPSHGPAQTCA